MGCNAWNHSPHCTCGWGGVGYEVNYRSGDSSSWYWQNSDSYTSPNARCPTCNAQVFFYRSPFGGRVYFDELGPPWPKHPCTDSNYAALPARHKLFPAVVAGYKSTQEIRREPGWRPMICEEIRTNTSCAQVVEIKVNEGAGGKGWVYAVVDRSLLDYRTPFLARMAEDGSIEISTLDIKIEVPTEIRFKGYLSADKLPEPFLSRVRGLEVNDQPRSGDQAPTRGGLAPAPNNLGGLRRIRRDPSVAPVIYRNNRNEIQKTSKAPRLRKYQDSATTGKNISNPKTAVAEQNPRLNYAYKQPEPVSSSTISAFQISQLASMGASKQEIHQQRLLHKIKMAKLRSK
jgi:hypothetical protein